MCRSKAFTEGLEGESLYRRLARASDFSSEDKWQKGFFVSSPLCPLSHVLVFFCLQNKKKKKKSLQEVVAVLNQKLGWIMCVCIGCTEAAASLY